MATAELVVQEDDINLSSDIVKDYIKPVSYTHLTLPTICSV